MFPVSLIFKSINKLLNIGCIHNIFLKRIVSYKSHFITVHLPIGITADNRLSQSTVPHPELVDLSRKEIIFMIYIRYLCISPRTSTQINFCSRYRSDTVTPEIVFQLSIHKDLSITRVPVYRNSKMMPLLIHIRTIYNFFITICPEYKLAILKSYKELISFFATLITVSFSIINQCGICLSRCICTEPEFQRKVFVIFHGNFRTIDNNHPRSTAKLYGFTIRRTPITIHRCIVATGFIFYQCTFALIHREIGNQ